MASTSINEMISLQPASQDTWLSQHYPEKMGNTADIAYGGCVLSMAINAGVRTVPAKYFLYSALGYYLGPTLTTEKVTFEIIGLRDTKTFRTLRVEAKQTQRGTVRTTFYITLDFQVVEVDVLKFNLPPRIEHPQPDACMEFKDNLLLRVKDGLLKQEVFNVWETTFALLRRFFEMRQCPESVAGQNVMGLDKSATLTQHHLPMTQKSSAYWFRARKTISHAESYAAISFVTDAALAFLPLTFQNENINDYGAISSLDCTLRFHTRNFTCQDWMLHEQVAEAASDGRTFSTGRVFNQNGVLIATMNQMSIIRPKASGTKSPAKL